MNLPSKEIKLSQKKLMTILLWEFGIPWIACGAVLSSIFILAGFIFDHRFFILSLIVVFIIIPFAVFFLYSIYGLQPLTAYNAIPHQIIISNENLMLTIMPPEEDEVASPVIKNIEFTDIKKIKRGADYFVLFSEGKTKGILIIPFYLFSPEDLQILIDKISQAKQIHSDNEFHDR